MTIVGALVDRPAFLCGWLRQLAVAAMNMLVVCPSLPSLSVLVTLERSWFRLKLPDRCHVEVINLSHLRLSAMCGR